MTFADQTLAQIARSLPGATAIFHRYALDFCCGGKQTLREAATRKALDLDEIMKALNHLQPEAAPAQNWSDASDGVLIEHLLSRYHEIHRQQLPELIRLAQKVEQVHSGHQACPTGLAHHLERMAEELENHMQKEEKILFPMIQAGMQQMAKAPVNVMRHEHDNHGESLAALSHLTHDYTLPEGACNTWTALYLGLKDFKTDLMDHIHLENNILFDRIDGQTAKIRPVPERV